MATDPQHAQRPYYNEDIDFSLLASKDEDFAAVLKQNDGRIDWQDPQAVYQLTRSLLLRDFNLTLTLPPDRLCPPVPVRWNYIRWLQDLLATTQPSHSDVFKPSQPATGLDIGVGASCIYSLLACSSAPAWRMHGTDIDEHSLAHARANVEANGLASRIKLHLAASQEDPLIPLEKLGLRQGESLDFVVCNPPFYSSAEDMARAYGGKAMPPSAVCTGSTNEMICEGGDAGFVSRILDESLQLRERVRWYSAMLGRLASVQVLVGKLREHGVGNFAVTNLRAGRKTVRWAVAWSFGDLRPANAVARHGGLVQAVLPMVTEWTIPVVGEGGGEEELGERVDAILSELHVKWQWRPRIHTGVLFARENTWSRSARRKRKFQEQQKGEKAEGEDKGERDEEDSDDEDDEPVALAVKIVCSPNRVDMRWLRGTDFTLWESFHGMVKRALGAREQGPKKKLTQE